jgi:AcrR family transcriptional regulator
MASKSPGRPRSERARKAILASALSLIEEEGITGVTIEAVADQAKVGKPTIYRYWSNARELAMAAMMEQPDRKAVTKVSDPPLKQLETQLKAVIKQFSKSTGKQAAILMASSHWESELSKAFRNQVILKSREEGRQILEAAIGEGQVKPDIPIDSVLDMIYGPIFYRLLAGHIPLDDGFENEIIETLSKSIILEPASS